MLLQQRIAKSVNDLMRFNFFLRTRRSGVRISQGAPFYKGFSDLPLKTAPPCYQFLPQGNVYSRSRCRVETPAEAGRSIICGMVKPFIQPVRRRRGNPNWGRPLPPAPAVPTEFETQVRHLGLTKQTCTRSVALRNWCERNKNRCYIPEWLLEEWGVAVEPYVSGAA